MHRQRQDSPDLAGISGPGSNGSLRGPFEFGEPGEEGILEKGWRIFRRQWHIVLQAVLITAALALIFSLSQEKQYTAGASILFGTATERIVGGATAGSIDRNREAATNESLVALDVVAARASRRLRGKLSPSEVAAAVSVVGDPEADIVTVEAKVNDPELSAEVANAYGTAFINFRQASVRRQIQAGIDLATRAQAQLSPLERQGEEGRTLRERINELETAKSLQTGGAELVQPATVPDSASSPKPILNSVLGALFGLIIGFSLAAVRERWGGSVKSVDALDSATSWPVLARLPRSKSLSRHSEQPARGAEAEAFRMLRATIRHMSSSTNTRSLLITSALPAEGKSTTARHLARTMAAAGDRVVLVDADMHAQGEPALSVAADAMGLSDVLAGADLDDALIEVLVGTVAEDTRSLTVLPRGTGAGDRSELLEGARMREIMDELQRRYDMVIIDSPPLSVVSDALALLEYVTGVVIVAAIGKTSREALRDLSAQMNLLGGGNVLGVVANFVPDRDRGGKPYRAERV